MQIFINQIPKDSDFCTQGISFLILDDLVYIQIEKKQVVVTTDQFIKLSKLM